MSTKGSPSEILKKFFERVQSRNSSYSQRALARDLEISPGQMNLIFNGKREITDELYQKIIKTLKLDDLEASELGKSLVLNRLNSSFFESALKKIDLNSLPPFQPLDSDQINLFEKWYFPAVLDLTTCSNYTDDAEWIAKTLSISITQVLEAFDLILKLDLAENVDGKIQKKITNIRFPTGSKVQVLTNYHIQNLQKTISLLESAKEDQYSRRHVVGTTLACNPDKIEKAKQMINSALYEITNELSSPRENCLEVYQLNIQLVPVSNNS
ncbi:MAG: TIGR02147 family protein [Bacteriovoracaceae bacterium]